MRKRTRVGIIGTGGVSEEHYRGYLRSGAEVFAIAEVNERLLRRRRREWEVRHAVRDFRELLQMEEVDAVSVCTPNSWHHPMTLQAAAAGKHVFCEKPIAMSLELAREMVDACRRAGVKLQVNHRLRASQAAARARKILADGGVGKLTFIRLRQAHDWAGAERVADSFGKRDQAGGGTLLDNGVHLMDLLRYFGGEVSEVFARLATLKFDVEVEDTAVVSVRFASGALGAVECAWTATGWEEGFWLYGTCGALEYTNRVGRNVEPVLYHARRDGTRHAWQCADVDEYRFGTENTHAQSVAAFLAAIRDDAPVLCTGEDGLEAVRLVLSAYESAEADRPVQPGAS